jgi:hypothetical protein
MKRNPVAEDLSEEIIGEACGLVVHHYLKEERE